MIVYIVALHATKIYIKHLVSRKYERSLQANIAIR